MFSSLALLPYLLIPVIVTFIWWRYKLLNKWNNITITILAAILYSFFLKETADGPPAEWSATDEYRCGLPALAGMIFVFFIKFILLVPASMLLQILFNFLFLPKRQEMSKETDSQTDASFR